MDEIIAEIKQITGVDEIFIAGDQTIVVTINLN